MERQSKEFVVTFNYHQDEVVVRIRVKAKTALEALENAKRYSNTGLIVDEINVYTT